MSLFAKEEIPSIHQESLWCTVAETKASIVGERVDDQFHPVGCATLCSKYPGNRQLHERHYTLREARKPLTGRSYDYDGIDLAPKKVITECVPADRL